MSLKSGKHSSDGWGLSSRLLTPLIFPLHSPGPLALKIAGRIAEFFPDAVLIMVRLGVGEGGWKVGRRILEALTRPSLSTQLDNQKLVSQPYVPPVIVLENHGLCWVPKDKNL